MSASRTVVGAWAAVVEVLREVGVRTLYGLPPDDLAVLAAIPEGTPAFVLCRDQRNALFMATGEAMTTAAPAVAVIGKGPAVTNAMTGILEANRSGAPVVLLAAGTAVQDRGTGAFQELDQMTLLRPLVLWAGRADHPDRVVPLLRKALLVAAEQGGPTYLELPDHLLELPVPTGPAAAVPRGRPVEMRIAADDPAAVAVARSRRPILLLGGGVRHADRSVVERFADATGAMLVTTASGRGAVDEDHPRACGLAGLYAPPATQHLWTETDLVIAVGSRLEETATHAWPESVGTGVPVLQINTRAADVRTEFAGPVVLADGPTTLAALVPHATGPDGAWCARVTDAREQALADYRRVRDRQASSPAVHVSEVLAALDDLVPADRILVQENGLSDMWSYHFPHWVCSGAGGSVVPSEQTSLGFGAAAAFGVKIGAGTRPVVALVGDGAFDMVANDLAPAADAGVAVLFVVLRNGGYGWLQAQADQRGLDRERFRFADDPGDPPDADGVRHGTAGPPVSATPPGVRRWSLHGKADLRDVLGTAWDHCVRRGLAVVDVTVMLHDSPIGPTGPTGEFPAADAPAAGPDPAHATRENA